MRIPDFNKKRNQIKVTIVLLLLLGFIFWLNSFFGDEIPDVIAQFGNQGLERTIPGWFFTFNDLGANFVRPYALLINLFSLFLIAVSIIMVWVKPIPKLLISIGSKSITLIYAVLLVINVAFFIYSEPEIDFNFLPGEDSFILLIYIISAWNFPRKIFINKMILILGFSNHALFWIYELYFGRLDWFGPGWGYGLGAVFFYLLFVIISMVQIFKQTIEGKFAQRSVA